MSNPKTSASIRRLLHFSFGACALLLPLIGWWGSVCLALVALAYNVRVAPRLGFDRIYRREHEGLFGGLTTYPLAVLLLVLFTPLPVAAGAWVVLASADPVAAEVGSRLRRPQVPGNPRKSLAGTCAGFLVAMLACWGILAYMQVSEPLPPAMGAAAAGALAEVVPLPFDDNLVIAGAAALVLLLTVA